MYKQNYSCRDIHFKEVLQGITVSQPPAQSESAPRIMKRSSTFCFHAQLTINIDYQGFSQDEKIGRPEFFWGTKIMWSVNFYVPKYNAVKHRMGTNAPSI